MTIATTPHDNPNATLDEPSTVVSLQAIIILIAGMVAAWLAAGSTGLLAHSLQHALTWLALGTAIVAAWPQKNQSPGTWVILAGSAAIGVLFTTSAIPTLNIFAVTVVLAAIAQTGRGLSARVALIASLATCALGLFRLACDGIPSVWLGADTLGRLVGRLAGWLAGSRLEVGATFAGLDFLVLMAAVYAGWLFCTVPPRRSRALWAAAAIVIGHFAYLAVLAHSENLLAILPDVVVPAESDINYVGIWTWGNGLRTLIPWNVPLLAVVIYCAIVAVMFRGATWQPVIELDAKTLKKLKEKEEKEEVPGSVLAADMLFGFGPVLLAIAAALSVALVLNKSDLKGKTIVAYEKGYLNWNKPEYDSKVDGFYGMLLPFVESLGGKFTTSKDLAEKDLETADVLMLLHPDQPWPKDVLERIWAFVRRGGSLLLAADPVICEGDSHSSFNELLRSDVERTSMHVRYDTAVTRTGNWEQSYEVLAHPATLGIDDLRNRFGLELGSSIETGWLARPALVGRWGWSDPGSDAVGTGVSHYNAGEHLGDLVLAAEQPVGNGRVFVLGGTAPLRNEMLTNAYPFVGRLLGYLAGKPSSPQTMWRQVLGLLAILATGVLLARRPVAWQMMLVPTMLSIVLVCCSEAGYWSGRVLPDGRSSTGGINNVAYIDATHLEAYSSDWGAKRGIAGLVRTLMRQGYLPLLAPDLTSERLERAGLLISIAPARPFSIREQEAIKDFVGNGGTFICMVGAEESRASAPLLAEFNFLVPPSPVPPGEDSREPWPLGAQYTQIGRSNRQARFYAAWPVECSVANVEEWSIWSDGKTKLPIIISRSEKNGRVMVIGDTYCAVNENLDAATERPADRIRFWHWLLTHVVPKQKPWSLSATETNGASATANENAADEDEDESAEEEN